MCYFRPFRVKELRHSESHFRQKKVYLYRSIRLNKKARTEEGRGEKRNLLSDPGCELRLGREKEKGKSANGIEGMSKPNQKPRKKNLTPATVAVR